MAELMSEGDDLIVNSTRGSSIGAGTLFLVATASVLAADALRPALAGTGYLNAMADHPARLAVAALFYLSAAGSSVGIAVALYPVLATVNTALALGSVVFRTIEAAFYTVAVVSLVSILPLARQFTTAPVDQRAPLRLLADSLVSQRDHATLAAVFAFGTGALLYYLPLYRARLVPRWLSGWGVVAILLMLTACVLALFSDSAVTGYWPLALPIAVQEIVLAIWLLTRGLTTPDGPSPRHPTEHPHSR
jgi:Domain of unknown function (DUF4386)